MAPSNYLNQRSDIVNWTLRNKLQWNLNQNTKLFIHENASENIICEMLPILSRGDELRGAAVACTGEVIELCVMQYLSVWDKLCLTSPMYANWRNKMNMGHCNPLRPGPRFNIKMSSYQYRKSHCGDKTVVRSSYLHNGISYTGKMTSLYWIRALNRMANFMQITFPINFPERKYYVYWLMNIMAKGPIHKKVLARKVFVCLYLANLYCNISYISIV